MAGARLAGAAAVALGRRATDVFAEADGDDVLRRAGDGDRRRLVGVVAIVARREQNHHALVTILQRVGVAHQVVIGRAVVAVEVAETIIQYTRAPAVAGNAR